jgi:hypothetical protein
MPSRHVWLRIKIGTVEIDVSSVFSQIVKLQLKLLATTGSPQNWSGTAINPMCNWPNIRAWLIWVPGYENIACNESADLLANLGSESLFTSLQHLNGCFKPAAMGFRTTHRTLSPKRTPFQIWINK